VTSAETLPFQLFYIKASVHDFLRKTCRDKHFGDQGVDGIGSEMSDCRVISVDLRYSPYDAFCDGGNLRVSRNKDEFLDQLSNYYLHGQDSLPWCRQVTCVNQSLHCHYMLVICTRLMYSAYNHVV